ncbi:hypothetical protein M427DRAFT_33694 [Gonapodya prolifera JEL478]|uniref:Uncharacterized protein n=1 Tax=Gonapodya prolifera (strain JEL478) TaxID=1344416 RepID=A0A139AA85_GONPJ|nr:hypothetical protein M427DRAFT_33694 [Gonapodya prolifera JEL478]|eukprot:KXS13721.1 hypothetical protein M427DRAFT_33694 [Gonapodya prolifera JEL478]
MKSLSGHKSRQSPLRNTTNEASESESLPSDGSDNSVNSIMSSGSSPALDFTSKRAKSSGKKRHEDRYKDGRHHKSKRRHADISADITSGRSASPGWNFDDRSERRQSLDSSNITPTPLRLDSPSTNKRVEEEENKNPSSSAQPPSQNEQTKQQSPELETKESESREQTRVVAQPEPPKPVLAPAKKDVPQAPMVPAPSNPAVPGGPPSKFKGIDFVALALSGSGPFTPDVVYSWIDNPHYVGERDGASEAAITIPLFKFTYSGEGWFNTLKNLKVSTVDDDKEILDLDFVSSTLFGLSHVTVHERMQIVLPPPTAGRRASTLPRVLRQRKSVTTTPNGTQSDHDVLLKEMGSLPPAAYNLVGQLSAIGYFTRMLGFDFVVSQRTGASVMMMKSQNGFGPNEKSYRRFLVSEKALGRCVYVKTHLKITEPLESKDTDLLLTVMSVLHGTASWRYRTRDSSS